MSGFIPGDRVILTSLHYGDRRNNPVWGGKHGHIVGTVRLSAKDSAYVSVNWDNGTSNGYTGKYLSLHEDETSNPNAVFRRRKLNA